MFPRGLFVVFWSLRGLQSRPLQCQTVFAKGQIALSNTPFNYCIFCFLPSRNTLPQADHRRGESDCLSVLLSLHVCLIEFYRFRILLAAQKLIRFGII